jgi:hypothetical protein
MMEEGTSSPTTSGRVANGGGICISDTVHDHVRDKLAHVYDDRGEQVGSARFSRRAATLTPSP